ncbi:HlyD family efflux transporter periplasmic adaptor subunit [Pseudoalteromonas sp.]|uniref:HlyD family secretion protein n=1 Tax=Pseudoalteromonas sp. TaxID=53249 RepID=UPI002355E064|nr:HlyD family efflux transporter periplasmic adaptor subunit [Pseudoalteromonas sp.]
MTVKSTLKSLSTIAVMIILGGGGWYAWQTQQSALLSEQLPESVAYGNGRIEATEYDIATKLPGRLIEVLAQEGDMVEAGQTLAVIDTDDLNAQLREANARLRVATESRKYALAIVEQHKSELNFAETELHRSVTLLKQGHISKEVVDQQRTSAATAQAALKAANVKVVQSSAEIEAAQARIERLQSNIADSTLKAPISGRILYRLAEPGEVLGSGGKVFSLLDLTDVYMSIYLPTAQAGRVTIGSEARIVIDAIAQYTLPAKVTFVSAQAQFTPKSVETRNERDKLMFRVKVKLDAKLLNDHIKQVKTGVPGLAYVLLAPEKNWPMQLQVRVPE